MISDAIMTQERWEALSEMERTLLASIGIAPVKPKAKKSQNPITVERRLSTRNTAPAPYWIVVKTTCGCCQSKTVKEGEMRKSRESDSFLSLHEEEIPAGEVYKQLKAVSVTCTNCEVELDKLSKEELISMIMGLRYMAAKKAAS